MRIIALAITAVALAGSVLVHIITFVPFFRTSLDDYFPVHIFVVLFAISSSIGIRLRYGYWPNQIELIRRSPLAERRILTGAFVYCAALFAWQLIHWNGGSLGHLDGRTTLQSHGQFIRYLSEAEAASFNSSVTRLFSAVWAAVLLALYIQWKRA